MRPSVSDALYMIDQLVARCSHEGMTGTMQFTVDMRCGGVSRTQASFFSLCSNSVEALGLDTTTGCITPSMDTLRVDTTAVLSYT